jgi:methylenetetrahydrofolate reductase (NADPH)
MPPQCGEPLICLISRQIAIFFGRQRIYDIFLQMQTLREKLLETSRFLVATELVSVRGSMAESSAIKVRSFANELVASPEIDWISVTDNAGGNPQLAPLALGRPILYAGKEVVIHLTCKDLNRNGLESEAWMLNSEGFHNILAMTGDYPVAGNDGLAKPVFDIDSIGLISMLNTMNHGLDSKQPRGNNHQLGKTQFCIGAVTTNFKLREGEVIPQYLKLGKKVECGAQFIINQIGFDSRKISELRFYMDAHGMETTPLIGNVYLLSPRVAQVFHGGKIPGVYGSFARNKVNPPTAGRRSSANLRQSRLRFTADSDSVAFTSAVSIISQRFKIFWRLSARSRQMTGNSSRTKSDFHGPASFSITRKIR